MTPQFPYRCKYVITQQYEENAGNRYYQHHGAIDILPLDDNGKFFPAPIYPILFGKLVYAADISNRNGKGVKYICEIDKDFIDYFKSENLVPKSHEGAVQLEIFNWHMLQVTDKDGLVDQNTPLGLTGNTGFVVSGGVVVPDEQKGVEPYLGGHLHFSAVLRSGNTIFNLDKDAEGRFDPMVIFNYKKVSTSV